MNTFIFIHSDIDDAGLDVETFRILCHIARRSDGSGIAFPSVKSAAKICRVNKDTVADRLNQLENGGWIERVKRPGFASGFKISSTLPPIRQEGISDSEGHPPASPLPIRRAGLGVIRREGSEGNPIKDIHEGSLRDFEKFWAAYPQKTAKTQAWKSWKKAKHLPDIIKILEAIAKQSESEQWKNPKFIPYPATWINGERWMDELPTSQSQTPTRQDIITHKTPPQIV